MLLLEFACRALVFGFPGSRSRGQLITDPHHQRAPDASFSGNFPDVCRGSADEVGPRHSIWKRRRLAIWPDL